MVQRHSLLLVNLLFLSFFSSFVFGFEVGIVPDALVFEEGAVLGDEVVGESRQVLLHNMNDYSVLYNISTQESFFVSASEGVIPPFTSQRAFVTLKENSEDFSFGEFTSVITFASLYDGGQVTAFTLPLVVVRKKEDRVFDFLLFLFCLVLVFTFCFCFVNFYRAQNKPF